MADRVLVFIDWYLPGYKAGGPISSCANMLNALRNEFEFMMITRDKDYLEHEPYPNINSGKWVSRAPGENVLYIEDSDLTFSSIKRQALDAQSDIWYINGIYSWWFSIVPLIINRLNNHPDRKVIVAPRGMLAPSAIGIKSNKKRLYLRLARLAGLFKGVIFQATSQAEIIDIQRETGKDSKVVLAENISGKVLLPFSELSKREGEILLVSIARIAPEKNLLFLLKALRDVKHNVVLNLYGSVYDDNYWQQCREEISCLPENISVNYCGLAERSAVPSIIQQHHFLVLPSRGENFGHVISESLLAGRPVLVSDQTPWQGLESDSSGLVISVDSTESWAEALNRVSAMNNEEYAVWQRGALHHGKKIAEDQSPVENHRALFKG
jgi:glycosyltransferase involved in cell wall biosynthesis